MNLTLHYSTPPTGIVTGTHFGHFCVNNSLLRASLHVPSCHIITYVHVLLHAHAHNVLDQDVPLSTDRSSLYCEIEYALNVGMSEITKILSMLILATVSTALA